jgi:hypothetical protein
MYIRKTGTVTLAGFKRAGGIGAGWYSVQDESTANAVPEDSSCIIGPVPDTGPAHNKALAGPQDKH